MRRNVWRNAKKYTQEEIDQWKSHEDYQSRFSMFRKIWNVQIRKSKLGRFVEVFGLREVSTFRIRVFFCTLYRSYNVFIMLENKLTIKPL